MRTLDVWTGQKREKRTVGERIYLCVLIFPAVDATETGEGVLAVDIHGARAADTLSTRAAESECWVYFILDFDERIKSLRVGQDEPESSLADIGRVQTIGPHSFRLMV